MSQEQKPKNITKPQPHIQPHLQPQQQQHSQLQSQSQSKSKSKPKLPKETARAAKRTKDKITYKSVSSPSPSPSPSPSSLSSLSASELHVPAEKRSHESLYSIGPVVANECIDLVHNPIRPNRIMKAAVGSTILTSKKPKPPSILLANFGSTSGSSLGSSLSGAPSLIYTNNGHMELHESELINHSDGIGMSLLLATKIQLLRDFFFHMCVENVLGDARLLEEHDLNNVLNQLPEDAFNEFFEGNIERYDWNIVIVVIVVVVVVCIELFSSESKYFPFRLYMCVFVVLPRTTKQLKNKTETKFSYQSHTKTKSYKCLTPQKKKKKIHGNI